tara:strand:+ start:295 stop:726 length:432 start_codon:yes stop_codon:yes gene_type:complete
MSKFIGEQELKKLFTKAYGEKPPSKDMWAYFYHSDVLFIDPTQEKRGLENYIQAQEKLMQRCKDVYLKTHYVAINKNIGFVEWTLGLKIQNKEFIYPGTSRLVFGDCGKIVEHRDYFDFCGPTFEPIPILGQFIRWLYGKFTN